MLLEHGRAVFDQLRHDRTLAEVRSLVDGRPVVLRKALDEMLREFLRDSDPSAGLAAVYLVQALVLAVLDEIDRCTGPGCRTTGRCGWREPAIGTSPALMRKDDAARCRGCGSR
jgi:hypothetical protein